MIVYNETYIIDEALHQQWLLWMQTLHLPAVLATGYFISYQILNVLDSPNEGVTYCIQYFIDDLEKLNQFNAAHGQRFMAIHQQQFENQFVMFNTVMQKLN